MTATIHKPKKRPWNRIDLPVYSVSSRHGQRHNMHICTYVSAVSMQPKRMMVALYDGTLTLELVEQQQEFVLQLLAVGQYRLVELLGKKSGHTIDKIEVLRRRGLLTRWKDHEVLKDALAWMHLKVVSRFDGGDHQGFVCDVVAYTNLHEGDPLTLDLLRAKKLIRI